MPSKAGREAQAEVVQLQSGHWGDACERASWMRLTVCMMPGGADAAPAMTLPLPRRCARRPHRQQPPGHAGAAPRAAAGHVDWLPQLHRPRGGGLPHHRCGKDRPGAGRAVIGTRCCGAAPALLAFVLAWAKLRAGGAGRRFHGLAGQREEQQVIHWAIIMQHVLDSRHERVHAPPPPTHTHVNACCWTIC